MNSQINLCCLIFLLTASIQTTSAAELYIQGKVYAKKESGQLVPQYFEEEKEQNKAIKMYVSIAEVGINKTIKRDGKYKINISKTFKPGDEITLDVIKPGWKVTQPLNGKFTIKNDPKAQTDIILEPINAKTSNNEHIYTVQTLNTRDETKAIVLRKQLTKDYKGVIPVFIEKYMVANMPDNGYEYKVKIGEFPEKSLAEQLKYGLSKRYTKLEGFFITLKDYK